MKRAHLLGAVLLLAGSVHGTPGAAQVALAGDLGLYSSYVWRGVTYTNKFVLQPDASLTLPIKGVSLTAGLWANVEPTRYNGFGDISENGGTNKFDVTEINWTGELGMPVTARTTLTLGATGYIFPNDGGLTRSSNSVELYGRAELATRLSPTASVYYDVGTVRGAYFEGGMSHTFSAIPNMPLTLGALAGLSAGQDAELDAAGEPQAEFFNFAKNGFTHADLWATADVTAGALAISPTLHVILTGDEVTKVSKIEQDPTTGEPRPNRAGAKLWFGVTVGWTR